MKINFVKMDGLGNTFIVLKGPLLLAGDQVQKICGKFATDGLLVVTPFGEKLIEMKYWNADGSAAEMCGNGLRCVTRFAIDNNLVSPGEFKVKTDAGILEVVWDGKTPNIEVQIGKARLETESVTLHGLEFYEVNVGNPHVVTFVKDTSKAPVKTLGPKIETDKIFPSKTNVGFIQILDDRKIRVRVWERGAGETKACGTGITAAAAASAGIKQVKYPVEVEVLGGRAKVWLDDENCLRMIGPAKVLSSGELEI